MKMKSPTPIHRQLFQSIDLDAVGNKFSTISMPKQSIKAHEKSSFTKVNRIGRPNKKKSVGQTPEAIQNGYMQIQFMRQQQRRKLKPNTKNLFSFFPTYTTLIDQPENIDFYFNRTIGVSNNNNNDYQARRGLSVPKQEVYIQQRNYSDRKRLIPLKKHAPIQKRVYKQQPKISFLNVEKVSLIPISKENSDQKCLMSKSSMGNKSGVFFAKQLSTDEDAKRIQSNLMSKIGSYLEPISAQPKIRQFTIPFQRYHYYDFLWKVGISNGIRIQFPENLPKKYKIYIGPGNNSMLIKTFFKRREFWWSFTDKIDDANFVWTQIKSASYHNTQKKIDPAPLSIKRCEPLAKKNQFYKKNGKILNEADLDTWSDYFHKHRDNEEKMNPSFNRRNRYFKKRQHIQVEKTKIHNHLPRNYVLGNKKALFSTMKQYYQASNQDIFQYLPLTFHIQNGLEDEEYLKFLNYYYKKNKEAKKSEKEDYEGKKIRNIWIVKPGEFSNRGNGIIVCKTLDQIKAIVKQKKKHDNGSIKTYIVQEYIDRPMLYCRRKFDIRHFMLITFINGHIKGYWYELGYIRTTSYEYSVKNSFGSVHLTNDAIQKNLPDYGKYEKGNKLSYDEFEKYLQKQYKGRHSFHKTIYPQMKKIAKDSMRASSLLLDPTRKGHNFQVFGFDFMIDANFHPWLIEINTNPCLEISCPVLMDIIPQMIDNVLKIGVDSVLIPPSCFTEKRVRFSDNCLQANKFELLFDSTQQEQDLKKLFEGSGEVKLNYKELQNDVDECFEDDGVELDD